MSDDEEKKIGGDVQRLRRARRQSSAIDAQVEEMAESLNAVLQVLYGRLLLAHDDENKGTYFVHASQGIRVKQNTLTLPTPEEVFRVVEERKKIKEEVTSLTEKYKDLIEP